MMFWTESLFVKLLKQMNSPVSYSEKWIGFPTATNYFARNTLLSLFNTAALSYK